MYLTYSHDFDHNLFLLIFVFVNLILKTLLPLQNLLPMGVYFQAFKM